MSLINQNKYNMKKLLRLFPLLLLCACVLTSCGSDDDGDGDSISNPAENEYVINGHKFIDLGLRFIPPCMAFSISEWFCSLVAFRPFSISRCCLNIRDRIKKEMLHGA